MSSPADAGINARTERARPRGLKWRSSVWFVTFVVALGLTVDLLVYSLIVPIIPFQLERLRYSDVSGLVGWLLFAYSAGIVLFTPPIAYLSERYKSRKIPMICGQVVLIGAQIMLMEAPTYWLMVLARLLQGFSSSVIWVAGLALLCDTAPENIVGRQLGIAMSGLSLGYLIGPPVSGALFDGFGFHGPFIFGVIFTAVDLLGRMLFVEHHHAVCWDVELSALSKTEELRADEEKGPAPVEATHVEQDEAHGLDREKLEECINSSEVSPSSAVPTEQEAKDPPAISPTLLTVLRTLLTSRRAWAVCLTTLFYGVILTSLEPALPLHLQAVWNLDASQVGLVYIAAVVPTLFSSTLTGWWVDKQGTGIVMVVSLLFAVPWLVLLILQKSLAFFIVMFALSNFGISGTVSALTTELATITRRLEGVGYAHVYGAFNLSYGVGSGLGPIIGGQMYDHVERGWMAICLLGTGLAIMSMLLGFLYFGDSPLAAGVMRRLHLQQGVERQSKT